MAPGDLMVQMVFQDFFAGNKFMGRAQAGEVAGTSHDDAAKRPPHDHIELFAVFHQLAKVWDS